ncbi:unnamed protein product [Amoebophrya sp. A120]|nr:unnamed protein product [Amoebophrya sp. A120]|eukprot:GSA120T00005047001.1
MPGSGATNNKKGGNIKPPAMKAVTVKGKKVETKKLGKKKDPSGTSTVMKKQNAMKASSSAVVTPATKKKKKSAPAAKATVKKKRAASKANISKANASKADASKANASKANASKANASKATASKANASKTKTSTAKDSAAKVNAPKGNTSSVTFSVKKSTAKNSTPANAMKKAHDSGKRQKKEENSAVLDVKHSTSVGVANEEKADAAVKYKYVVYQGEMRTYVEFGDSDSELEDSSGWEPDETDVRMVYTSEDCGAQKFWNKIDELCACIKEDYGHGDEYEQDYMAEYDARFTWQSQVAYKVGKNKDSSSKIFGEASGEEKRHWSGIGPCSFGVPSDYDPEKWNKGMPQDATLVATVLGMMPYCYGTFLPWNLRGYWPLQQVLVYGTERLQTTHCLPAQDEKFFKDVWEFFHERIPAPTSGSASTPLVVWDDPADLVPRTYDTQDRITIKAKVSDSARRIHEQRCRIGMVAEYLFQSQKTVHEFGPIAFDEIAYGYCLNTGPREKLDLENKAEYWYWPEKAMLKRRPHSCTQPLVHPQWHKIFRAEFYRRASFWRNRSNGSGPKWSYLHFRWNWIVSRLKSHYDQSANRMEFPSLPIGFVYDPWSFDPKNDKHVKEEFHDLQQEIRLPGEVHTAPTGAPSVSSSPVTYLPLLYRHLSLRGGRTPESSSAPAAHETTHSDENRSAQERTAPRGSEEEMQTETNDRQHAQEGDNPAAASSASQEDQQGEGPRRSPDPPESADLSQASRSSTEQQLTSTSSAESQVAQRRTAEGEQGNQSETSLHDHEQPEGQELLHSAATSVAQEMQQQDGVQQYRHDSQPENRTESCEDLFLEVLRERVGAKLPEDYWNRQIDMGVDYLEHFLLEMDRNQNARTLHPPERTTSPGGKQKQDWTVYLLMTMATETCGPTVPHRRADTTNKWLLYSSKALATGCHRNDRTFFREVLDFFHEDVPVHRTRRSIFYDEASRTRNAVKGSGGLESA